MALTYYIRSWDPRSTYPTNPQEGDICYTITLDQTWAPVGGVKKDNIVKEEVYQNGAWVEQGGGGGGSDVTWIVPIQDYTTDGNGVYTLSGVDTSALSGDCHLGLVVWEIESGEVFNTTYAQAEYRSVPNLLTGIADWLLVTILTTTGQMQLADETTHEAQSGLVGKIAVFKF